MKTKILTLGMAIMTVLFMSAAPVQAQTKQQTKDAKKEAKKLEKQGYKSMGQPLYAQFEKYYALLSETDQENNQRYIIAPQIGIANSYAAAKMQAIATSKNNLAGFLSTTIMTEAHTKLANDQISAEDATSITKAIEKGIQYVSEKLQLQRTPVEYYRVLDNKNYEVHIILAYDTQQLKNAIKTAAVNEAKKNLDQELDFKPFWEKEIDKVVDNAQLPTTIN